MAENELGLNEDQLNFDDNQFTENNDLTAAQTDEGPGDPVYGAGQRVVFTNAPGKTVKVPSGNIGHNIGNTLKLDTYEDVMSSLDHLNKQDPYFNTGYRSPKPTSVSAIRKYDDQKYGYIPGIDLDDFYGKQESWYQTLGKAVPRFAISTVAKTLQSVGYIGGLLTPSNYGTEEGVFSKAADNALAKVAKDFEETSNIEWFPTFQEAADREKGFWARAATDLDFWTTDVVDGLSFMAAAWTPGIGLSKMGIGAKAMRGIGSMFKVGAKSLGATIEGAETVANYFKNAKKAADGLDAFSAWSLATASESMFEANGVRDDVMKALSYDRYGNPVINPETGRPFTEDEKRKRAGEAAQNTFLMNSILLGGTNVFEYRYISKMFNRAAPTIGRGIIAGELGQVATAEAAPSALKVAGKTAALGVLREGFIEENMQLAIQRYNTKYGIAGKVGSMLDLSTYGDVLTQYGKQTKEAIQGRDPEAAANIGIGGILGSVISAPIEVKQSRQEYANGQKILAALNESQNQWIKAGNIFKTEEYEDKDENGTPFKSKRIYLDENSKPVVDQEKLAAVVSGMQINNEMLMESEQEVNTTKQKFLRAESFADLVSSYINAGIEDTFLEKLDKIKNYKSEDIAKLGFFPDDNINEQIDSYKQLAATIIKQNKILNSDLIFDNSDVDGARKGYLTNLAAKQAVRKHIANDLNNEITGVKNELLNSDNTSLSDGLVDQLNEMIYRIESQKATIAAIKQQNLQKFFPLDVYENVLAELEKNYDKLKKDNVSSLENIKKDSGSMFYNYEKDERNESGVRDKIESKIFRRGELLNEIRNTGFTWARYADLKNGKKNYSSDFESIIDQHKKLKEQKQKEKKETQEKKEDAQGNKTDYRAVEADDNTFSVASAEGDIVATQLSSKEEAEAVAQAINQRNADKKAASTISEDSSTEDKKAFAKEKIDSLPDDALYAVHITDEGSAKKAYDTSFEIKEGVSLGESFKLYNKEQLYNLVSDIIDDKSPIPGSNGFFIAAFPYSEFGTPSETNQIDINKIEDELLYEYPEVFEGNLPSKFNFAYFNNGILTTKQDTAPATNAAAENITEQTTETLQEYLDKKHASLSENPAFKVPYDQWINSAAINSHIKDYNKKYGKNEPLFGEKPAEQPEPVSTDAKADKIIEAKFAQQETQFYIEVKGDNRDFLLTWNRNSNKPTLWGEKQPDGTYKPTLEFPSEKDVQVLVDKYVPKNLLSLINKWTDASKLPAGEVLDAQDKIAREIETELKALEGKATSKSDIQAKKDDIERRRQEELEANKKLAVQDLKTKVAEKFETLPETRANLKQEVLDDDTLSDQDKELLIVAIDGLFDISGSNPFIMDDLAGYGSYNIKKFEEYIKYNFPDLTKKQITDVLSKHIEHFAIEHKGSLLATLEGPSGLPSNLAELNAAKINAKYDAELAALEGKTAPNFEIKPVSTDPVMEAVDNLNIENITLKDVPSVVKLMRDTILRKASLRSNIPVLNEKIKNKINSVKDEVARNYLSKMMTPTSKTTDSQYVNQIEAGLPVNNPEHKYYDKINIPSQMLNTGFELSSDQKVERLFGGVSPSDLNGKVRVVASRVYVNKSNDLLRQSNIPNRTIITLETNSEIENKLMQGQSVIARTFKMDGFHINIYSKNNDVDNVYVVGVDGYAIVNPDNSTQKVEFTEDQRSFVKDNMLLNGRKMTDQEYDMLRGYYLKMQEFQDSIADMVGEEVDEVDITGLFNDSFTFSRAGIVAQKRDSIESLIKNNPNKLFTVQIETENGEVINKRLPLIAYRSGTSWSYEFPLERGESIVTVDTNTGETVAVTNVTDYIKNVLNLDLAMTSAYGGKIAWIAADNTEQRGYKPYTLESIKGTEPVQLFKNFVNSFKELKKSIENGEKTKVYEFNNKTFSTRAALLKEYNRFHYGFFQSNGFYVDLSYNPKSKKFLFEILPANREQADALTPEQRRAMHLYFKTNFTKITDATADQEVENEYNTWVNDLLINFDTLHKNLLSSTDNVLKALGNTMKDYHVLFNYEDSQNARTFYLKLQDKNAKKNNSPVSFLYYNATASEGGRLQVAFNDVTPTKPVSNDKPIDPVKDPEQPTKMDDMGDGKKSRKINRKITKDDNDGNYMLSDSEQAYEEYTSESFKQEVRWLGSVLRNAGIELRDLGTIIDNLRAGKQVLGYYKDQAIYVNQTISKRGVVYHEAFHALFRNILTADQRAFYTQNAKEVMGQVTLDDINKFRNERGYFNKTDEEIHDLMGEEYLADGFMRYKLEQKDPKYSWFKRFVRTLERIINFFLNNETAIESLYKDFDAGRYASNKTQAQTIANEGVFAIAMGRPKLHLDTDEEGEESFTSDTTVPLNLDLQNELINKLAYLVANDAKDSFTQKFNRAVERLKSEYNIEDLVMQNPEMSAGIRNKYQDRFYEASFILGESVPYALSEELTNEPDAVSLRTEPGENQETLDIIRKAVKDKIKNLGLEKGMLDTDIMIPEDEEDIEEKQKTGEFDTIHMNPLEGISSEFRSLFSMIPYTYEDRELGIKVEKMADGKALFNATIKVASDTPINKILPSLAKSIQILEEDNDPNTVQLVAFRDFLNREFGMDISDPDALPSKNIYLYKQFIDTFFVTELPSYQIVAETTKLGTSAKMYDATINHDINNKKDAIAYYFESNYRKINKPEDKLKFIEDFKKMQQYIKDSFLKNLDNTQMNKRSFVNKVASEMKDLMDAVNINIPKSLIRQSMLAIYTFDNGNTFDRNSKENIRDINIDQRLMKEKAYLEKEFFLSLSLIQNPENFSKIFSETKESTANLGKDLTRVKQINTILKNSMKYVIKYDITNPIQVYQNAELKNVWRYSRYTPPILLTQMVREAGGIKPITDLYPVLDAFFADNKLFDGSLENQLFLKNLYVSANGGFRQEVDKKRSEGVTFGHIDTKALLLSNIVTFMNRKTITEDLKNEKGKYVKTSITTFLRSRTQEEATTTNFFITGKYERYITEDSKPNSKFINVLVDGVRQEYNRIKREWASRDDMDKVRYELYNDNIHPETDQKIEGDSYITKDGKVVELRAYQFKMFEHFFDEQKTSPENEQVRQELKDVLRNLAKRDISFEEAMENDIVKTHLQDQFYKYMDETFENYLNSLYENNLVELDKNNKLSSNLIPKNIKEDADTKGKPIGDYGYPGLDNFLYDHHLNIFANKFMVNQIFDGDIATGIKSGVEFYKRNKSGVISGNSAKTGFFRAAVVKNIKALVDMDDLTRYSEDLGGLLGNLNGRKEIDIADGQAFHGINHRIRLLDSWGRVDPRVRYLLNKYKHTPLSDSEIKELSDKKITLNSMKTATGGVFEYYKLSEHLVSRVDVSHMLIPDGMDRDQVVSILDDLYSNIEILEDKLIENPSREDAGELENEITSLYQEAHQYWMPKRSKEKLHYLLNSIELSGVDMVFDPNASKKTTVVPVALNANTVTNLRPSKSNTSNLFKFLQVETSGIKDTITLPTQARQILTTYIHKLNTDTAYKNMTLSQLAKEYNRKLGEISSSSMNILEKTFTNSDGSINYTNLYNMMYRGLKNQGASSNDLKFFEIKNGEPVHNPNLPRIKKLFTYYYFSMFSNNVFSNKVSGRADILVSSYGQEVLYDAVTGKVITTLEQDANPMQYQDRNRYKTRHLGVDVTEENGVKTYTVEVIIPTPLAKNEAMKEMFLKKLNIFFSTRIPTEDKRSMVVSKVVDYMDNAYQNSIVVPQLIHILSGSDLDVDKLYSHTFDYYMDYNDMPHVYGDYSEYSTTSQGRFVEYINYMQNSDILKDAIDDEIERVSERPVLNYDFYKLKEELGVSDITEYTFEELKNQREKLLEAKDILQKQKKESEEKMNMLFESHIRLNQRFGTQGRASWEAARAQYNMYKDQYEQSILELETITEEVERMQNTIKLAATLNVLTAMNMPTTQAKLTSYLNKYPNPVIPILHNQSLSQKISILSNEDVFKQYYINERSSSDMFRDVANSIGASVADIVKENSIYSIMGDVVANNLNSSSKDSLGIAASFNKFLSFAEKTTLTLPSVLLRVRKDGVNYEYSTFENDNGVRRTGESIGMFADAAKDPIPSVLNLNPTTAGVSNIINAMTGDLRFGLLINKIPFIQSITEDIAKEESVAQESGGIMKSSITGFLKDFIQDGILDLNSKGRIGEFYVLDKDGRPTPEIRKMFVDMAEANPDFVNLEDPKTTDLGFRVFYEDGTPVTADVADIYLANVYSRVYSLNGDISRLTGILNLIKKQKPDFGQLDKVISDIGYFMSGDSKFKESIVQILAESKEYQPLIKALYKLDEYSRKLLLERSPLFISINRILSSGFNNTFGKRNASQNISDQIGKFIIIQKMKAEMSYEMEQLKDKTDPTSIKKYAILKESFKYFSADTWMDPDAFVKDIDYLYDLNPGNPFVEFIKINNRNGINLIEAGTRMKMDKDITENILNGYEALQKSDDMKTMMLSRQLFYYLLVKDGLGYSNNSFLGYLNADLVQYKQVSENLTDFQNILQDQMSFMDARNKEYQAVILSGLSEEDKRKAINKISSEIYANYTKLLNDFFRIPESRSIDWINGMITKIFANASNQQYIRPTSRKDLSKYENGRKNASEYISKGLFSNITKLSAGKYFDFLENAKTGFTIDFSVLDEYNEQKLASVIPSVFTVFQDMERPDKIRTVNFPFLVSTRDNRLYKLSALDGVDVSKVVALSSINPLTSTSFNGMKGEYVEIKVEGTDNILSYGFNKEDGHKLFLHTQPKEEEYDVMSYFINPPSKISDNMSQESTNKKAKVESNMVNIEGPVDSSGFEFFDEDDVDAFFESYPEERKTPTPTQSSTNVEPKGEKVKDGIYVNQEGLTKEEQLELFDFLKPILEKQAIRSNKGKNAPKMAGLELNWDYVSNRPNQKRVDVKGSIRPNNTYGWFQQSANGLPLEKMSPRFKELMSKAVGIDVNDYDGSIVNIYNDDSFIGNHPDIDESATAENYPVVVANIGGTGNIVLGTNKDASSVKLKAGAGYLFGFQGKNRTIPHSTYASSTQGFLPALTTEIDGETYAAGSYRISITMRRVMPLEKGMSTSPAIKTTQPIIKKQMTEEEIEKSEQDAMKASLLAARKGNKAAEIKEKPQSETTKEVAITYAPKGKAKQAYKIVGSKIYNKNGVEVFKEDSVDRNKIFANLAVKEGRAKVVEYKDSEYVVNNKKQIISVATGKIMQWPENNGDRLAIINLAFMPPSAKPNTLATQQKASEKVESGDSITPSDVANIYNSRNENLGSRRPMTSPEFMKIASDFIRIMNIAGKTKSEILEQLKCI